MVEHKTKKVRTRMESKKLLKKKKKDKNQKKTMNHMVRIMKKQEKKMRDIKEMTWLTNQLK